MKILMYPKNHGVLQFELEKSDIVKMILDLLQDDDLLHKLFNDLSVNNSAGYMNVDFGKHNGENLKIVVTLSRQA